jgi:hypothetical protein
MNESTLQHIYQSWQQGNENYARDWSFFVEYVAKEFDKPADEVIRHLQKYSWFIWPHN